MHHEEKLKKVCNDFSLLNEDQQDYVLGILQALVFAKTSTSKASPLPQSGNPEKQAIYTKLFFQSE